MRWFVPHHAKDFVAAVERTGQYPEQANQIEREIRDDVNFGLAKFKKNGASRRFTTYV